MREMGIEDGEARFAETEDKFGYLRYLVRVTPDR